MTGTDSIGFTGGYNGQYTNWLNVAEYALGTSLVVHGESPFQGFGGLALFEGIGGAFKAKSWITRNLKTHGSLSKAWEADMQTIRDTREFMKGHTWKQSLAYSEKLDEVIEAQQKAEKLARAQEGKGFFNYIKQRIFKKAPPGLDAVKAAEKAANTASEEVKAAAKLGKEAAAIDLGAKGLKCLKGNALFWAVSAIGELFTVVPTFAQLGPEKGMKQVLKSAAKVGATVVGWEAGAAAGAALGTLIFPGAGTLVGGIVGSLIGVVGGCLGSWAANKVVEPFCKSELEIAKEEQAKQLAQAASQDPEKAKQLLATAAQRLQSEDPNKKTEDGKMVSDSIIALANQLPQTQTQDQTQTTQDTTNNNSSSQYNPNFFMDPSLMAMSNSDFSNDIVASNIDWAKCVQQASLPAA